MASLDELKAALARGDRAAANRAISALVRNGAPLGQHWRSLATLAMHHGELDLAMAAIRHFVAATGGAAAARREAAILHARAGRPEAALGLLAPLGDDPHTEFARATIALDMGDLERARMRLRSIVERTPLAGEAWLALSTAGGIDDRSGDRLLGLVEHRFEAPTAARVAAFHAAGAVLHARGAHDAAFGMFANAAAEHQRTAPHDRDADSASANAATGGFGAPAAGDGTGRAIFVTGLPRSGTTLVEQILTAHSAVAGGGELNLLRLLAQEAGGADARAAARADKTALADLYDHLLSQRFGSSGRIVDKSLNVSRMLGLIDTVLPDSPVIWVRRDPLDCAWSCFRTHFAVGARWSLNLGDIAHHMRLEDELHRRWAELLGSKMLTVQYAELVTGPDAHIAKILRHCGLAEEPGPYAPHTSKRTVTTASSVQVRQPIGRFGLGVAAPYRRHLQPFVRAYASRSGLDD